MELIVGKCRIRMDFGFPAVLALLFLHGDGILLRQIFAVCLIHEIGHGIAMLLTNAGIREIHFYAAGVQMRTNAPFVSKTRELVILLSGPCMNFAAAGVLHALHGWSSGTILHLGMGLFNLLPYAVLDGGSALQCIFSENRTILRMQTAVCILISVGIMAFCAHAHIANPTLYLMPLYLAAMQLRVDKQGGMW